MHELTIVLSEGEIQSLRKGRKLILRATDSEAYEIRVTIHKEGFDV